MTAPLMAGSAATCSTMAESSSITLRSMTFIERPGLSQVMSAMPSPSISSLKCWKVIGESSPCRLCYPAFAERRKICRSSLRARVGFAGFAHIALVLAVALRPHVDVGIVGDLARRAAADLEIDGVAAAAVDQAMAVGDPGFPAGRVPRPQHGLAVVLDQHQLAFEHIDELILGLMPMALRGGGAGLETGQVDAELIEPDRIAQPLALAALDRAAKRLRIAGAGVDWNLADIEFRHRSLDPFDDGGGAHADPDAQRDQRGR